MIPSAKTAISMVASHYDPKLHFTVSEINDDTKWISIGLLSIAVYSSIIGLCGYEIRRLIEKNILSKSFKNI